MEAYEILKSAVLLSFGALLGYSLCAMITLAYLSDERDKAYRAGMKKGKEEIKKATFINLD